MINLILDTQTWIYLANGYNQASSRYEDGQHLKLYSILKDLNARNRIHILVNEVIIDEWSRNKDKSRVLIEKCEKRVEETGKFFESIKKNLSEGGIVQANTVFEEYRLSVFNEIDINEKHINNIENLILNESIYIPISNQVRIDVSRMGQQKTAPFHNKNNSVGDALILLSTIEYLKNEEKASVFNNSIFISNNSDDYCEKKGSTVIHPDLKVFFDEVSLQFETNIGRALNLSQEIIKEVDEFNRLIGRFSCCLYDCVDDINNEAVVEYSRIIKIPREGQSIEYYNPKQLSLELGEGFVLTEEEFDLVNSDKYAYITFGNCNFCEVLHLRCDCGEEHYVLDEDKFIVWCSCGTRIEKSRKGYEFEEYNYSE